MNIIFFFTIPILVCCLVMLLRNQAVFQFRMDLLNQVSTLARQDVAVEKAWEWRYTALQQVSYDDMMYKFWLPLESESFWADLSFLE